MEEERGFPAEDKSKDQDRYHVFDRMEESSVMLLEKSLEDMQRHRGFELHLRVCIPLRIGAVPV